MYEQAQLSFWQTMSSTFSYAQGNLTVKAPQGTVTTEDALPPANTVLASR
jgi:hypothetical protein